MQIHKTALAKYFNSTKVQFRAGKKIFVQAFEEHFNSTKVQFRGLTICERIYNVPNFNSTKVQFRVGNTAGKSVSVVFQFH